MIIDIINHDSNPADSLQVQLHLFSKDYACLCHVSLQYKLLSEVFCLLAANQFQVHSLK